MQLASKKKYTQLLLQETASMKDNKIVKFSQKLLGSPSFCKHTVLGTEQCQIEKFSGTTFWTSKPRRINSTEELSLSQCYDDTISKIRGQVHGKKIFVSIGETTDVEHRYVTNVVIGTLEIDGPGEVFLLTSEVLEAVNHSTICRLLEFVCLCYDLRI